MKAVILAAGEGSRMRPLTYTRPKVMLPIVNKPILEHLLVEAVKAGVKDFVFIVGYCDKQVRDYFGDGSRWQADIVYRKQTRQLGTADAVRMVEDLVDGNFLVINGDIIAGHDDIQKLAASSDTTMSLFEVQDTRGLGVVEVSNGKAVKIHEKTEQAPTRLANAGIYLFTPAVLEAIAKTPKSPRGEYEITDSLQVLMDRHQGIGYHLLSQWADFSYPWDLLAANESLCKDITAEYLGTLEDRVTINGEVRIGQNTRIRSGAYIDGPVVIGEGCDIGPNCLIRPCTAIGNGCHIGGSVEVKNSIIMNGTRVPHHNYIGDSIIGEGCNFGAGTKIANLRLDEKEVWVNGVNTRRRKLGAIIGDGVKTGINASINVGTMIGNNASIGPGTVASGNIMPNTRVL